MAPLSWYRPSDPITCKAIDQYVGTFRTTIEFIRIYHSAVLASSYIRCVCVPAALKALDIQLFRAQFLKGYSFATQEDSYIFTLVDPTIFR